jgi:hypothetical protein
MALRFILFLLLFALFFPVHAGSVDLSAEEAAAAFLKALETQPVVEPPRSVQLYTLLPPLDQQGKRTTFYLQSVPTHYSLLDPRTLVRSTNITDSYLVGPLDPARQEGYVGYARVNRVEVTQLKKLSENEYKAEFMLGYAVGPFGSLLFGRELYLQRPQDALFDYRDNGWRIKFIKTF